MKRRWLALAAFYALLLGGGWALGQLVSQWAAMDLASGGAAAGRMVWLVSAVYIVASALPFVPGAEIGLGLIAMFGGRVALLV